MRHTRLLATLPALALVLAACGGDDAVSPSLRAPALAGPSALISDGSRAGGNPNFFFLAPLVPNPSGDSDYDVAGFNGGWKPIVQVCRLGTDVNLGCTTPWLRTFASPEVSVSTVDEHYKVNWSTSESWATPGLYRARVALVTSDTLTLGFIDVALLADQKAAKNLRTGEIIPLHDGRTVPLKFRIEDGAALVQGSPASVEQVVTQAGDTVRAGTGAGSFALGIPAGWLPVGVTEVVVTIEQLNIGASNECLVSVPTLLQTSNCWRVRTYPALRQIRQDLIVAFCPALAPTDPRYDAQSMFKFDAPARLEKLATEATLLVDCDAPATIGQAPEDMWGRVRYHTAQATRAVGRLFAPATAWAVDAGWGGRLVADAVPLPEGQSVFSEFFWGIPLRLELFAGGGQTGAPGSTLPVPTSVRVVGTHSDGAPIPIAGIPVRFFAATGTTSAAVVATDASGIAAVSWTLGTTAGTQSLRANITSIGTDTTVVISGTAATPPPLDVPLNTLTFCGGEGYAIGDQVFRGFYLPSFPGTAVTGVELQFGGSLGTYVVALTARAATYDGVLLGADTASVTFGTVATGPTTFQWPAASVAPGSTVTFAMQQLSGPTGPLFYSVATTGDGTCPIVQTNDTAAPLGTFRRQGVRASIYGVGTPIP